jgi:acyl-CoA reductase-like NAD-dependent aldehyde dehydrogenase
LKTRLAVLRRFRSLLVEQATLFAHAANCDHGRSLSEIIASEIIPLADACKFLEREAARILSPRRIGRRGRAFWLGGVVSEIIHEPHGVVLVIAPSNYPVFIPGVQALQALVAGNAVWLKPGPAGLAAAVHLSRMLQLAGLPRELLVVLPESTEAVSAAIACGVDKVFFTGSARTGSAILSQLAPRAVPSVMELSGSDAVIVRTDADLELAARALVFGLRLNSGQTCIAPRRVLVARSVATEFEGRLARALAGLGNISIPQKQQQRLGAAIRDTLAGGAHLIAGIVRPGGEMNGPLVLAGVSPQSPLLAEDVFGPVLSVITVANDEEAVSIANSSDYALGATIFSRNEHAARSLAARLHAGVVLINDMIAPTADARLPFGGRKLSGFGATRGREGLLEMAVRKVVTVNRGRQRRHFDSPQPWHEALFLSFLGLSHGNGLRERLSALRGLVRAVKSSRNNDHHSS